MGAGCSFQNKEDITQIIIRDYGNTSTLLSTLKSEVDEDDKKCHLSAELHEVDANLPPHSVKKEPEDSHWVNFQLQVVNVDLKEEINIEDHEPGWEELVEERRNSGINNGAELDRCDSVQENELQSSERVSEGEMKYHCVRCSYKTNRRYNYAQHYIHKHKQHTEMYKCAECTYETRRKYCFNQHKCKLAKEAEVYKCEECSYETIRKADLSTHRKYKHSKVSEVFKCDECSFESIYKSSLIQHYKLQHITEAELYKCRECSYQTKNKSHFNRHHNCKHSEEAEVYQCMEYSYQTRCKSYLTKHYKYKHEKEAERKSTNARKVLTKQNANVI